MLSQSHIVEGMRIERPSLLRVDDLEIDRQRQQVSRGGKRIELTPREFSLLEFLVANAGKVMSRRSITEHVWDESFQGLANIVDVYVRHLRNKVDDESPKKLIRTVRGIGYSIGEETEK
jgi:DNA-binding response OmpR family regulator